MLTTYDVGASKGIRVEKNDFGVNQGKAEHGLFTRKLKGDKIIGYHPLISMVGDYKKEGYA